MIKLLLIKQQVITKMFFFTKKGMKDQDLFQQAFYSSGSFLSNSYFSYSLVTANESGCLMCQQTRNPNITRIKKTCTNSSVYASALLQSVCDKYNDYVNVFGHVFGFKSEKLLISYYQPAQINSLFFELDFLKIQIKELPFFIYFKDFMTEPLLSSRIRIPTKDKSDSISEIQHEQLRVSFSVLSILSNEDNKNVKNYLAEFKTCPNQEEINKQYVQYQNNLQKARKKIEIKEKFQKPKIFQNQLNQYRSQYFDSTDILTPKSIQNKGLNNLNFSNKSSNRNLSNRSSRSKNDLKSKEKSVKKSCSNKKNQVNFTKSKKLNVNKGINAQKIDFKFLQCPLSPKAQSNFIKNRAKSRTKSCKQITILCHEQQNLKQQQKIQKNKLNQKQNLCQKQKTHLISTKKNIKKVPETSRKQYFSEQQIGKLVSNYWNNDILVHRKSKPLKQSVNNQQNQLKGCKLKYRKC